MVATIYGEALAAQARTVISQLNHAAQEISDLRDGTGGRIAVGTLLAASAVLLPTTVAQLQAERPRLIVTVREGTNDLLMPALRCGDLDIVVGRLTEFRERQDLGQEVLLTDTACVVVRSDHPLVRRGGLSLSDLVDSLWILPPPETTLRRQIEKSFRDQGIEPPLPAVESVSLLMNRALLLHGDYVSVWPWQVAYRDIEAKRLAILPVPLPPTTGPIVVTTRPHAMLSPATVAFIEMLRSVAKQMEPSPLLSV
jgi:DNA-binding transcriptional LysR family regulator